MTQRTVRTAQLDRNRSDIDLQIDFTRLDSSALRRRVCELRTIGFPDRSIAHMTGLGVIDVRRVLSHRSA
jgi:hypothetical protein